MIWRNVIVFLHNLVIVLVVLWWFPPKDPWLALTALPGLLLVLLNAVWIGLLLGVLCARFRDIPPIITSLVQLAFFLTPVLWHKEMLGGIQWAADLNPLYHLIELVRAPLLGQALPPHSWPAVLLMTALGFAVTLPFFARYRGRIAYWV